MLCTKICGVAKIGLFIHTTNSSYHSACNFYYYDNLHYNYMLMTETFCEYLREPNVIKKYWFCQKKKMSFEKAPEVLNCS